MYNVLSSKLNKNLINVLFEFDGQQNYARPVRLTWNNEDYFLGGVQFWYAEIHGGVRVHHYRVSDENGEYTFDLSLETENLTWRLEKAAVVSSGIKVNNRLIGALS